MHKGVLFYGTGIFICSFSGKNNTGRRTGLFRHQPRWFPLGSCQRRRSGCPARDMCRLLQTALLPENLFVLMLPSRSHTATSMERFFRLQRRITSGSKTMTGQITDISKIAVRLMGFSYKKNCGQASFWGSSCRSSFSLFFSDKTHPLPFCSGGQYLFCRLVNVSF